MAKTSETVAPAGAASETAAIQAELEQLRQQVAALSQSQPQAVSADAGLATKVADLQIRLAALGAKLSPADVEIRHAQEILDRIEGQRKRGGKYRWFILNRKYSTEAKGAQAARQAGHYIYSDATTPDAAEDDFRRRTGVQHDPQDKLGREGPFRAIIVDPQLLGPPTSLEGTNHGH